MFHWIIVQDDRNSISTYESIYDFCKNIASVYIGQFVRVVHEMYSYIVCVYFLYCDTLENIHHNHRHYHFKWINDYQNGGKQQPTYHNPFYSFYILN